MERDETISEFNESIQQLIRLNKHWVDLSNAREAGDMLRAKWKLDSIELELGYDAKKLDQDKNKGYVKKLLLVNAELESTLDFKKLYKAIKRKEEILREIQQESGKGSKYKSLYEDDMD